MDKTITGQVLYPNAVTTPAIRKALQEAAAKVSTYAFAKQYGLNSRTVQKWHQWDSVKDRRSGPQDPHPKSLSRVEEAACLFFRCATKLPLDDCLNALQEGIPHLKRANLHRLYQNFGISKFPKEDNKVPETKTFKEYPIGYFHVDIDQVNTQEGRLYMFVAIHRTSKFAYIELHEQSAGAIGAQFLETVIEKVPYAIHTVLTNNGSQFTNSRNPEVFNKTSDPSEHKNNKSVKCNAFGTICEKAVLNISEHVRIIPGLTDKWNA